MKMKRHRNFATFYFQYLIWLLRTQVAPNLFFFCELFAIKGSKKRVWYIKRHINNANLEKKNTTFCSITSFHKIGEPCKNEQSKKKCVYRLQEEKLHSFQYSISFFEAQPQFYGETKFWWFFNFESWYLENNWSDFDDFFASCLKCYSLF